MAQKVQNDIVGLFGKTIESIAGEGIRSTALRDAIVGQENLRVVGGYLVAFGQEQTDTYGTWFDANTYYGPRKGDEIDCLVQHGFPLRDDPAFVELADTLLSPIRTTADELGIWAETVLDLNDAYQAKIYEMVQQGLLSWSSATSEHMLRVDAETGYVRRWPFIEGSYTPTPANYKGGTSIAPLRSLLFPEPAASAASNDAEASTPNPIPSIRAVYLGEEIEIEITSAGAMAGATRLLWRFSHRIDRVLEGYDDNWNLVYRTPDEKMAIIGPMTEEFSTLLRQTIDGMLRVGAEQPEVQDQIAQAAVRSFVSALRVGKKLSADSLAYIDDALGAGTTVVEKLSALRKAAEDGTITEEEAAQLKSATFFRAMLDERFAGIDLVKMAAEITELRTAMTSSAPAVPEPDPPSKPEPTAASNLLSLADLRKRATTPEPSTLPALSLEDLRKRTG